MKILVISDEIDHLIYSDNIKKRFSDIDLVISCGDLPYYYYDYIVTSLNVPLYYVFGNHAPPVKKSDDSMYMDNNYPPGGINLDNKIIKHKNLLIGGLEGSIRYNWDPKSKQYTNFEMKMKIMKMKPSLLKNRIFKGRGLDILVTHAPPLGIHDEKDRCHTGFKPYIKFMEKYKPKFLLHGHVHLYDKNATWKTKYNETTVINAYGHRVIEIDT